MAINFKQKLRDLIENSRLLPEEKDLWELFMMKSIPDEDEAVYEVVSESFENLQLLTDHLRDKILSMEKELGSGWQGITEDQAGFSREIDREDA